jgi:hypothetical protein
MITVLLVGNGKKLPSSPTFNFFFSLLWWKWCDSSRAFLAHLLYALVWTRFHLLATLCGTALWHLHNLQHL